jgi:short-subunit dehydrogenase
MAWRRSRRPAPAAIGAEKGFDLLVAADRPGIHQAADRFRGLGADVTVVEVDLATTDGVDRLWAAAAARPVDALLANAGHGLGRAFLDQDFEGCTAAACPWTRPPSSEGPWRAFPPNES